MRVPTDFPPQEHNPHPRTTRDDCHPDPTSRGWASCPLRQRQPPPQGHRQHPGRPKSIRAVRPDGAPIYAILENLSAHTGMGIRRWAKKEQGQAVLPPAYASWAHPIVARCGSSPWPTRTTAAAPRKPGPCTDTRAGATPVPPHLDVLAARRSERARIRSEKGIRWGGRPLTPAV